MRAWAHTTSKFIGYSFAAAAVHYHSGPLISPYSDIVVHVDFSIIGDINIQLVPLLNSEDHFSSGGSGYDDIVVENSLTAPSTVWGGGGGRGVHCANLKHCVWHIL